MDRGVTALAAPAPASAPAAAEDTLDPEIWLRFAVVCLGIVGSLWRASAAVGVPRGAWPILFGGALLAALQLGWAVRLALRPGRGVYAVGAAISGGLLLLAAGVAAGLGGAPPPIDVVTLLGTTGAAAPRVLRAAAAAALVTGAVTLSALVGGAGHAHAATRTANAPTGVTPFICHLI